MRYRVSFNEDLSEGESVACEDSGADVMHRLAQAYLKEYVLKHSCTEPKLSRRVWVEDETGYVLEFRVFAFLKYAYISEVKAVRGVPTTCT